MQSSMELCHTFAVVMAASAEKVDYLRRPSAGAGSSLPRGKQLWPPLKSA